MKTKILQFGEGNFLRCFIDWMVQRMNDSSGFDGSVRIIQPIGDELSVPSKILNDRAGRYHTCLRGFINGKQVEEIEEISCVEGVSLHTELNNYATLDDLRFVVSNTTEAGIEYVADKNTFPAKVAKFLQARQAASKGGLVFIPCELIEHNGDKLKECILKYLADWNDEKTAEWVKKECVFCSTLVDRIVAGRPDAESAEKYATLLGENDETLVCGEPFHFFVVETPNGFDLEAELPLAKAGINVVYTPDMQPYRTRKVRFLNGAHTATIPEGILAGFTEVDQLVADEHFNNHFKKILFEEIYPTVDLPDDNKRPYAESVLERFTNPFAHHKLLSIALNSISKWKVRVLPTVIDYKKTFGKLPENLWRSLDWLIKFYTEKPELVNDSEEIKSFFATNPSRKEILAKVDFWGMDLNELEKSE
jgi:tagaturonate reductase